MNYNIRFDFVKHRRKFYSISILITILGLLTLGLFGLNLGVDFKAGTNIDIYFDQPVDKEQLESVFGELNLSPALTVLGNNERATARFDSILTDVQQREVHAALEGAFPGGFSTEANTVDPGMAQELAMRAIYAVAVASIGIIIYVSIRFEWRFAIAAIIAILHDAFIVISIFSIFRLEVSLPFVAAVLTIIGYSINDTIIIFDRIRENLRFSKTRNFEDLARVVNESVWQTMTRSINTGLTVLFGSVCLLLLGSPSITLFSLAITIGLISGAYSSIFIASPIWLWLKHRSLLSRKAAAAVKE